MERNDVIKQLRKEGLSYAKIGKRYRLSRQRIEQIVHHAYEKNNKVTIACAACGFLVYNTDSRRAYCDECRSFLSDRQGRELTREVVRLRDFHTCRGCREKWHPGMRRFDVHHLNGLCGEKSLMYDRVSDISGLITLCHKCHFNHPEHSSMKRRRK